MIVLFTTEAANDRIPDPQFPIPDSKKSQERPDQDSNPGLLVRTEV